MQILKSLIHKFSAKTVALLVLLICLLLATVGGVYAFIISKTPSLKNEFQPVRVTAAVEEEFDGSLKKNVCIRNTGDVEAYIRAAVIINWVDESGKISAVDPVRDTDYQISGHGSDWVLADDGFWYYRIAVMPNAVTENLLDTLTPITQKEGYHLQVQVVATAVQAYPEAAVKEAFGVDVNDGILVP